MHSNNTQFSRYGDYFVTGGSDKMINVWKTGFYDSLNEKILENEAVSCSGKSYKPMDIKNTVNNST